MQYYLEKISVLLHNRFAPSVYSGMVLTNAAPTPSTYRQICFFFDQPQFMHIGDQFYFKPLARRLLAAGYSVTLKPTAPLAFFFRQFPSELPPPESTLFISRTDLLPTLKRRFGKGVNYFLYNTNSRRIQRPISNHLLDTFNDYFGTALNPDITASDYVDVPIESAVAESFRRTPAIMMLNNYVDSGGFRLSAKRREQLLERLARDKAQSPVPPTVIHLGTEADKNRDARRYDGLVDVDLRGQTSLQELVSLLALPNIAGVYCHDTATLHIANFFNQPVRVIFKRYFKAGENAQKRRVFASLFEKPLPHITFLP